MQSLKSTNRITIIALFVLYIAVLSKYILFRRSPEYIEACLRNVGHFDLKWSSFMQANFIPFRTIFHYLSGAERIAIALENLLGNFIGFMPLGLLAPLIFQRIRSTKGMLLVSFCTSLLFETIQIISGLGVFDIDDLILNTAGGVAGYLVFVHFKKQNILLGS